MPEECTFTCLCFPSKKNHPARFRLMMPLYDAGLVSQ
jgi:hypothetical protein